MISSKHIEKRRNKNKNLHFLVWVFILFLILFLILFGIIILIKGIEYNGLLGYYNGYLFITIGVVTLILLILAKLKIWRINKKYK